jgi:hypothetical protein
MFGQFHCPSSGVFSCTFGTGICHAVLMTAFKHDQDGTGFILLLEQQNKTSSILVVLESCHQNCMTYTSAECTAENS